MLLKWAKEVKEFREITWMLVKSEDRAKQRRRDYRGPDIMNFHHRPAFATPSFSLFHRVRELLSTQ
jgi:hypothetical protein